MARTLLWIAYVWNDHNFQHDPKHYAQQCAVKLGIGDFDKANDWLEGKLSTPTPPSAEQQSHALQLAELMRGLEIPPSASSLLPEQLYLIGKAIADQAKENATVEQPDSSPSAEKTNNAALIKEILRRVCSHIPSEDGESHISIELPVLRGILNDCIVAQTYAEQPDSAAVEPVLVWHEISDDSLARLDIGKATSGDQMMAANAIREAQVFADMYSQFADMIEPYVIRLGKSGQLPASVIESVEHVFQHWVATKDAKPQRITEQELREVWESASEYMEFYKGLSFDDWVLSEQGRTLLSKLNENREPDYKAEVDRLNLIINSPQKDDFIRAVSTEAEHQRQRWGSEHDGGKTPADWFWLVGYLAGKALHAHAAGNVDKTEHHIITTAAACANWHRSLFGKTNMRPGIDPAIAKASTSTEVKS